MTKAPFYKRPFFILITTLLIGALIGAALTGAVVRNRLQTARQITQAEGYAKLINRLIAPVSAKQRTAIDPIISKAGQNMEQIFRDNRIAVNQQFEAMMRELEPHLTAEQTTKLRERRQLVRERYTSRK